MPSWTLCLQTIVLFAIAGFGLIILNSQLLTILLSIVAVILLLLLQRFRR